jgi:hypothetical protein
MPRYRASVQGWQFLAVDLSVQLRAGTFEYALNHLIDRELDLSEIEARYKNDEQGAVAYRGGPGLLDRIPGLLRNELRVNRQPSASRPDAVCIARRMGHRGSSQAASFWPELAKYTASGVRWSSA